MLLSESDPANTLAVNSLPVIWAACASLHRRVGFVTYQPDEIRGSPHPDVLPLLLGNVATSSIKIPHEDEVLEGRQI